MNTTDLFGNPIDLSASEIKSRPQGLKRPALMGTGPSGKRCKTCEHLSGRARSKTYHKCGLMKRYWTGGPGTDIRLMDPACSKYSEARK